MPTGIRLPFHKPRVDNTPIIRADKPWKNGYVESFNGKLRDELLNREVLDTLRET